MTDRSLGGVGLLRGEAEGQRSLSQLTEYRFEFQASREHRNAGKYVETESSSGHSNHETTHISEVGLGWG